MPEESIKEKLMIFQKVVLETIDKVKSNIAISKNDKDLLQERINEIAKAVNNFTNKDDTDTMIKSMEEFAEGKITRDKIAVVEEVLYEIMQQQILLNAQMHMEKLNILENSIDKMSVELENMDVRDKTIRQNSRLDNKSDIGENKAKEIVCDKQFLTHLELSQVSVNKELTFNLIEEAMNNKNADLVLAGLTSLANDQAPTAD